jgi:DNA-binding CsgD family transcriptional regulator
VAGIAESLGVSERTVRDKLGLTKRQARVYDAGVLFEQGLREDVIADRLAVDGPTVRRYLRENAA